jgi:hypothetical protein
VLTSGIFKFGYGQWELIRNHCRQSELLRFNWVAKARSTLDIQKRCDYLINHRFKRENALIAAAMVVPKKKVSKEEQKEGKAGAAKKK